ncbi:MAG: methylmalonyl-CoA mutase family protein [Chitinophagales bacterium]|nr:methylmalonyl-CoA mutase family protein [Chitinophagales bacterium]
MSDNKLFQDFERSDIQQWEKLVASELKGESIEKLDWNFAERIPAKPYYSQYQGGHSFAKDAPWVIRQDFVVTNEKTANQSALLALNGGVDAIGFELGQHVDLKVLLNDILVEHIRLHLKASSLQVLDEFQTLLLERGISGSQVKGSFTLNSFETVGENCQALKPYLATFPQFSFFSISIQEKTAEGLSEALNKGVDYLDWLTENGFSIEQAADKIQFHVKLETDFFKEIVALKVLRQLWQKILFAYGYGALDKTYVVATNANDDTDANMAMLKNTTRCMAAIVGGADEINIQNYQADESKAQFLERIARNTQLILRHESKLDKVFDPSAGAYFVDAMVNEMATATWHQFLEKQSSIQ